jgi:hypothetical protein
LFETFRVEVGDDFTEEAGVEDGFTERDGLAIFDADFDKT